MTAHPRAEDLYAAMRHARRANQAKLSEAQAVAKAAPQRGRSPWRLAGLLAAFAFGAAIGRRGRRSR